MSYDVSVGAAPVHFYEANYTSNIWRIWDAASGGGGLTDLSGLTAAAAAAIIERVLAGLRADPERYRALEPANKWGSLDTFVPWLERLLEVCREHPRARVHVNA